MNPDLTKIKSLLDEYNASTDAARRGELLDELQDAVGLSGKMVTDNDITRKAKRLLEG